MTNAIPLRQHNDIIRKMLTQPAWQAWDNLADMVMRVRNERQGAALACGLTDSPGIRADIDLMTDSANQMRMEAVRAKQTNPSMRIELSMVPDLQRILRTLDDIAAKSITQTEEANP
jgi:hypothetical protein